MDKVKTLREIGVTRLSLGVENFDDRILEENGRAHLSPEILKAWDWIQQVGFAQVNIDLISGMVGETDDNWNRCIEKIAKLRPDNITIYQMELPFNTVYSKEMREKGTVSPGCRLVTETSVGQSGNGQTDRCRLSHLQRQ